MVMELYLGQQLTQPKPDPFKALSSIITYKLLSFFNLWFCEYCSGYHVLGEVCGELQFYLCCCFLVIFLSHLFVFSDITSNIFAYDEIFHHLQSNFSLCFWVGNGSALIIILLLVLDHFDFVVKLMILFSPFSFVNPSCCLSF